MSKVQMLIVTVIVLALLASTAHHVQARPGPRASSSAEILSSSSRQLLSVPVISDPESMNLSERDAEELDSDEELDAVCLESGTCDERRMLTASIDYKSDGPNNPITDPPH